LNVESGDVVLVRVRLDPTVSMSYRVKLRTIVDDDATTFVDVEVRSEFPTPGGAFTMNGGPALQFVPVARSAVLRTEDGRVVGHLTGDVRKANGIIVPRIAAGSARYLDFRLIAKSAHAGGDLADLGSHFTCAVSPTTLPVPHGVDGLVPRSHVNCSMRLINTGPAPLKDIRMHINVRQGRFDARSTPGMAAIDVSLTSANARTRSIASTPLWYREFASPWQFVYLHGSSVLDPPAAAAVQAARAQAPKTYPVGDPTTVGMAIGMIGVGNDQARILHFTLVVDRPSPDWGPTRKTWRWPIPSTSVMFNSLTHNRRAIGDERRFLQVRFAGTTTGSYKRHLSVQDGQRLYLLLYYDDDASPSSPTVATNTRVRVLLPRGAGTMVRPTAEISASNATPESVSATVLIRARRPFRLVYVPRSAGIWNGYFRGKRLSDRIASYVPGAQTKGALIGASAMNGSLAGSGEEGWVRVMVRVVGAKGPTVGN